MIDLAVTLSSLSHDSLPVLLAIPCLSRASGYFKSSYLPIVLPVINFYVTHLSVEQIHREMCRCHSYAIIGVKPDVSKRQAILRADLLHISK